MKMKTLEDLLVTELRDVYDAEKKILKALPKMAKVAASEELRAGFTQHLEETRQQVQRLETAFERLDLKPRAETCEGMQGLLAEGEELLEADGDPSVRDAGLIAAAQKVEHYEIASYGCLVTWAKQLGHTEVAELMAQTLEEEKATDAKLTRLAESMVNFEAQHA